MEKEGGELFEDYNSCVEGEGRWRNISRFQLLGVGEGGKLVEDFNSRLRFQLKDHG